MSDYSAEMKRRMVRFYASLNERDRRRYAAIEAQRLGHGGIHFISGLLKCDPKTIAHGIQELEAEEPLNTERQRKKRGWSEISDPDISPAG
jgi:hypothetical protein